MLFFLAWASSGGENHVVFLSKTGKKPPKSGVSGLAGRHSLIICLAKRLAIRNRVLVGVGMLLRQHPTLQVTQIRIES